MLGVSASMVTVCLTACGGQGGSANGASCDTNAPGITSDEVHLGLVYGDSGPAAQSMGAFRAGVDARLGYANALGGASGRKVVYSWADDQSDTNLNKQVAQGLVAGENVFGLIEGPGAVGGSIPELNEQNIPVTGVASDPGWAGKNNMFSWTYLGQGSTTTWGEYLKQVGAHRVAVIAVSGNQSNGDFSRQFEASLLANGLQISQVIQIAEVTTNYHSVAQQMKAANIDSIAGALMPATASTLLPALRQLGVSLKAALMPLGYDAGDLQKYGAALAGTSVFTSVRPIENPTAQQRVFLNAMAQYAPQIMPAAQDSAMNGWMSADLFLRGLREAGPCPTRQSFITNLRKVTNYDTSGLAAGIADLSTNLNQVATCYDFVQYNNAGNGFNVLPNANGGTDHCGTEITPAQMDQLLSTAGL